MSRVLYPRPELVRDNWINLNGEWEFEFDYGKTAIERRIFEKDHLDLKINVPFCPESKLSGLSHKDFILGCAYKRTVRLEKSDSKRIILNFEAVYYQAKVFINGNIVGTHEGGYTPFSFDITDYAVNGDNTIFVACQGDARNQDQPSGKQCTKYNSRGCSYTRTTGIFAPVWIEYVPNTYLKNIKIDTDIDNSKVDFLVEASSIGSKIVELVASLKGEVVGIKKLSFDTIAVAGSMDISKLSLWAPETPTLYDLTIIISDSNGTKDVVNSYFGMRKISMDKFCMKLNNKRIFQRLVLDQGYNPDGIYTVENDEDFERDILLSKRLGFNGARLHERIFERRFLYECDRLGYLVWDEYPNWGFAYQNPYALQIYLPEWKEVLNRDYNHPSIIGWCPFNETWTYDNKVVSDKTIKEIYYYTKDFDKYRPCIDTSGGYHVVTDIFDVHDYNQNTDELKAKYEVLDYDTNNEDIPIPFGDVQKYAGEVYMVSEYGGIKWAPNIEGGWGYGQVPKSIDEYVDRYCKMIEAFMSSKRVCGIVYTQLYDIEQEQNGIYYYDRTPKFDDVHMDKMRDSMLKTAAIELD